eukprot:TRINITY_DN307_c0_g1_i1.p1 TRINITY_DN307_c0_g1~~TRINITY_DN307_c0_g1_i1.p1  ORF type:complete len:187 (+),score=83.31 TRINITY_DN307_c0_g1_i1:70-561(+)
MAAYHPLLDVAVPKGIEYSTLDDTVMGGSNWTDSFIQQTGFAFLIGGGVGTAVGTLQGIRQTTGNPHMKLRVNGILNAAGRRGSLWANSAAAVVLTFHCSRKVVSLAVKNKDDDAINYIGCAVAVGALLGAAKGTKQGIMGAIMGAGIGTIGYLGTHSLSHSN